MVGPPRFELELLAPQARRIPSYPTAPQKMVCCFSPQQLNLTDKISVRDDHSAAAVAIHSQIIKHFLGFFTHLNALNVYRVGTAYHFATCETSHRYYHLITGMISASSYEHHGPEGSWEVFFLHR